MRIEDNTDSSFDNPLKKEGKKKNISVVKRKSPRLWEVKVPGLYVGKGKFIGESTIEVDTIEKVQQIIAGTKELSVDVPSLKEHVFPSKVPREVKEQLGSRQEIKNMEGSWQFLTGEGMIDLKTGEEYGMGVFSTDRLDTTMAEFLKRKGVEEEKSSINSEIKYNIRGHNIQFTDLENYNPQTIATNIMRENPLSMLEKDDEKFEKMGSKKNVDITMSDENWQNEYITFVEDFIEGIGKPLAQKEGIEKLDNLSPRQAIIISQAIADHYKDYDHNHKNNPFFDKQKIIEIIKNKKDNGVCRTFASVGKVFFDALKLNQKSKYNKLTNTHSYVTRCQTPNTHADNTYVTVLGDGELDVCITDPTYDQNNGSNLEKYRAGKYSLLRSITAIGRLLSGSDTVGKEELEGIGMYFEKVRTAPGYVWNAKDFLPAVVNSVVTPILRNGKDSEEILTETFSEELFEEASKIGQTMNLAPLHIENLYKILSSEEQKYQFLEFVERDQELGLVRSHSKKKEYKLGSLIYAGKEVKEKFFEVLYNQNQNYISSPDKIISSKLHWIRDAIINTDDEQLLQLRGEINRYIYNKQ